MKVDATLTRSCVNRGHRKSWCIALFLGVIVFASTALTGVGSAIHKGRAGEVWQYSFNTGECGVHKAVDPITVMFYGGGAFERELAGAEGYAGDLNLHKGQWTRHSWDSFFKQEVVDPSVDPIECPDNKDDTDLATLDGIGHERGHLRMWTYRHQLQGNFITMMTPHMEDWQWWTPLPGPDCGNGPGTGSHFVKPDNEHGKSGFDRARYKIYEGYRGGSGPHHHALDHQNWGNTYSAEQCNGGYASSSGGVWLISIGRVN